MSMSKKFQIPTTPNDQRLFHTAARRAGLSAAEWARRLLRREAERAIQGKSWDRLFSELKELPDGGEWEAPQRTPARAIKSGENGSNDW